MWRKYCKEKHGQAHPYLTNPLDTVYYKWLFIKLILDNSATYTHILYVEFRLGFHLQRPISGHCGASSISMDASSPYCVWVTVWSISGVMTWFNHPHHLHWQINRLSHLNVHNQLSFALQLGRINLPFHHNQSAIIEHPIPFNRGSEALKCDH